MSKEIGKLGAILLLITAVCAGLLATVNSITKPIIAEEKQRSEQAAMQVLLPTASIFTPWEVTEAGMVKKVFVGYEKENAPETYVGAVVTVSTEGYGGTIELLVGTDANNHIVGIQVLSHAETPGLGANMEVASFRTQFENKLAPLAVTKSTPKDNEIVAITGATITSNAVVDAVNAVATYMDTYKETILSKGGTQ